MMQINKTTLVEAAMIIHLVWANAIVHMWKIHAWKLSHSLSEVHSTHQPLRVLIQESEASYS